MNFKNILIIGGGGYIGSRLAQEISNINNVVCLDNFIHTTKKIDNITASGFLEGNMFFKIESSVRAIEKDKGSKAYTQLNDAIIKQDQLVLGINTLLEEFLKNNTCTILFDNIKNILEAEKISLQNLKQDFNAEIDVVTQLLSEEKKSIDIIQDAFNDNNYNKKPSLDVMRPIFVKKIVNALVETNINNFLFTYPNLKQRLTSAEDSLTTYKLADWGASTTRSPTSLVYNNGINDLLRLPINQNGVYSAFTNGISVAGDLTFAWKFTLDEIVQYQSAFYYISGSKAAAVSTSIGNVTSFTATSTSSYSDLLTLGVNSFTTVFQGGTDGFNILEGEPLRNTAMSSNAMLSWLSL
jgi:hypothetical protein